MDTGDIPADRFNRDVEFRLPAASDKDARAFSDAAFGRGQADPALSAGNNAILSCSFGWFSLSEV
jgi:hypothetical protein